MGAKISIKLVDRLSVCMRKQVVAPSVKPFSEPSCVAYTSKQRVHVAKIPGRKCLRILLFLSWIIGSQSEATADFTFSSMDKNEATFWERGQITSGLLIPAESV